jgi:serine/threonine protein kinase
VQETLFARYGAEHNEKYEEWKRVYNKDEPTLLNGPGPNFITHQMTNTKGWHDEVRYSLMWSSPEDHSVEVGASFLHRTPPIGLKPAGELLDPGLFDIDVTTGDISAMPRRNGIFSMWLLAVDTAGTATEFGLPKELDQLVIKHWNFQVQGKPDFEVVSYSRRATELPPVNRGDAPYVAADRIGAIECVVGTTYHFAPIDQRTLIVGHASGGADATIRYSMVDPPPGFFIEPSTGEIQGRPLPSAAREEPYATKLLAIDPAGASAVLETVTIAIVPRPVFNPVFLAAENRRISSGDEYTDPTDQTQRYVVHTPYLIARLALDEAATTVSAGAVADITYTLSSTAPDSFFVQATTGNIFGTFADPGTFEFEVVAVDLNGERAAVETLRFDVRSTPIFKLNNATWNAKNMTVNILSQYQLGVTYEIPGPAETKEALLLDPAGFDYAAVTYTTRLLNAVSGAVVACPGPECPGKFFVSQSGEMLIKLTQRGTYNAELVAQDSAGAVVQMKKWRFEALPEDTRDRANGPNQMGCGGGVMVDTVKFDKLFTCVCDATRFTGANCDVDALSASKSALEQGSAAMLVGVMAGVFVTIVFVTCLVHKRRTHTLKRKAFNFKIELRKMYEAGELEEDQASGERVPREIKRSNVTLTNLVGEGQFGEVWKGILDESASGGVPGYMVAIKTSKLSTGEGADEMMREAAVMAQYPNHPNLVALVGVVTSGLPLLLLLSFCEYGSLLGYLEGKGPRTIHGITPRHFTTTNERTRIRMAFEIARGMAHLAASRFVHRDLAARNVLVDSEITCKVADFGLARGTTAKCNQAQGGDGTDEEESYYRSKTGTFPVRWTAPEAMQTMRFSEATDVWSFAVVVLEIFTSGKKPYAGMSNAAVITKVQAGYRDTQPEGCPDKMYATMLKCWAEAPAKRPSFKQLVDTLSSMHTLGAAAPHRAGADKGARSTIGDAYLEVEQALAAATGNGVTVYLDVQLPVAQGLQQQQSPTKKSKSKTKKASATGSNTTGDDYLTVQTSPGADYLTVPTSNNDDYLTVATSTNDVYLNVQSPEEEEEICGFDDDGGYLTMQ